jgi:hypothetical protein
MVPHGSNRFLGVFSHGNKDHLYILFSIAKCLFQISDLSPLEGLTSENFKEQYDEKYAKTYGNYRIDRITEVVEEFLKCGDYKMGIARVKCTNSNCNHDFFVPLSCLCFYLCPSCHQKRTLLFGEQIANEVLKNRGLLGQD